MSQRNRVRPLVLGAWSAVVCFASVSTGLAADAGDATTLPLKRVVLYKHGIGYFEREGTLSGDGRVALRFKQSEMGDVLKSLTVLDRGGGRIETIAYESQKPANELLGEFAFDLRQDDVQLAMLRQLRGARVSVEVAGRGRLTGAVLGIDERTESTGAAGGTGGAGAGVLRRTQILSLFADSGEVVAVDLYDLTSLEFTDAALASDLQRYLATLRTAQRRDERTVELVCGGTDSRSIFASYAIEQPVWKASYRLVMLEGSPKPLLQGWAIVDNTSDEDWVDVDLSLIAGLPVSFRHDLYTPRHAERPLLVVNEQATASLSSLMEGMEQKDDAEVAADFEMAKEKSGKKLGDARAVRRAGKPAAPGAPAPAEALDAAWKPMSLEDAFDAQRAESVTREIGDLLEYRIDHKVTIPRNRSALLPIVKAQIDGERVALYREWARGNNPLSAMRIRNTSGVALEGGPLTVLEDETYAGEAYVDSLKPQELRYVPFAVELGVKAESKLDSTNEHVHRVEIRNGVMRTRYDRRETKVYSFTNREKAPRKIVVEHPRRNGFRLLEPAKAYEEELDVLRFTIDLNPDETRSLTVIEALEQVDAIGLANFTADTVLAFENQGVLNDASKQFLKDLMSKKQALAELQREVDSNEAELRAIETDQERVRGNLRSLRSSQEEKELRRTYLDQLKNDEARLKQLRVELAAVRETARAKQAEIDRLLADFSLEYTVK